MVLMGIFELKGELFLKSITLVSGDVALRILQDSRCEYLVTDAFGGYSRAVRELNENRGSSKKPACNK